MAETGDGKQSHLSSLWSLPVRGHTATHLLTEREARPAVRQPVCARPSVTTASLRLKLLPFEEALLGVFCTFTGALGWVEGLASWAGSSAHALARALVELPVGPARAGEEFVSADALARVSVQLLVGPTAGRPQPPFADALTRLFIQLLVGATDVMEFIGRVVASGGGKHEILLSEAPADVAVPRVVGGAGLVGSLALWQCCWQGASNN